MRAFYSSNSWSHRVISNLMQKCRSTRIPQALTQGSEWVWRSWGDIIHSVRSEKPAFEHVFGTPLFDYYDANPEAGRAGQAIYNPATLALYDIVVLGISNRLIWRCPTRHILQLYNQHATDNHLDVGVGTGWYLDHCRFLARGCGSGFST